MSQGTPTLRGLPLFADDPPAIPATPPTAPAIPATPPARTGASRQDGAAPGLGGSAARHHEEGAARAARALAAGPASLPRLVPKAGAAGAQDLHGRAGDPSTGAEGGPQLGALPGPRSTPAPTPSFAASPPASRTAFPTAAGRLDWALVRAFRQQAADHLAAALRDRDALEESARHELGRSIVLDLLTAHADDALTQGMGTFDAEGQHALAAAVLDALFGLGRLQPLVDNPDVENIELDGCDRVFLQYSDGHREAGPPVADTDEELIDSLAFLASRTGTNDRPFSPASPYLDLRLDDGSRLAASAWVTPRPAVVIRRHRLRSITLGDLVGRGMLSSQLAAFLTAAVRAGKSMIISGPQGAGKTTIMRALCAAIDPTERIGTVETERELHLHELPERHELVRTWEARPGSGERSADGTWAGELTLDEIVYRSFRFNLDRLVVGEVRGKEVLPMLESMQAGRGSLSTTHAHSARAAIGRLVTCALKAGREVSEAFVYRQIAENVDLIVQIALETTGDHGARSRQRYVCEVIAVEPGESTSRPAVTDVFAPGPDGRAVPHTWPEALSDLGRYGFGPEDFTGAGR